MKKTIVSFLATVSMLTNVVCGDLTSYATAFSTESEEQTDAAISSIATDSMVNDIAVFTEGEIMTIDDVIELSKKSNALTLYDLAKFKGVVAGSGIFILEYSLGNGYTFMVGSMTLESIDFARLSYSGSENYIDIRTDDVMAFLNDTVAITTSVTETTTPTTTTTSTTVDSDEFERAYDLLKQFSSQTPGLRFVGDGELSEDSSKKIVLEYLWTNEDELLPLVQDFMQANDIDSNWVVFVMMESSIDSSKIITQEKESTTAKITNDPIELKDSLIIDNDTVSATNADLKEYNLFTESKNDGCWINLNLESGVFAMSGNAHQSFSIIGSFERKDNDLYLYPTNASTEFYVLYREDDHFVSQSAENGVQLKEGLVFYADNDAFWEILIDWTPPENASNNTGDTVNLKSNIASDDELAQWAIKDYHDKSGVTAASTEVTAISDAEYAIVLKDADGSSLDTYIVDPKTGIGTDSSNETVDLPQTGNNSTRNLLTAIGAVLMIAFGAVAVKFSGVPNRRKRNEK